MEQINNSTELIGYKEIDIEIPAHKQVVYQNPYQFLRLLSSSGASDALLFRFGSSSLETFLSVGLGLKFNNLLASVTIRNLTNAPVTIRIAEIYGSVSDDRLVVSGKVETDEVPYKNFAQQEITLDANGQGVVDSSAYKYCIVQNSGNNPIYIGAANGLEVQSGGTFEKNLAAAFTVYGTAGDKIKVGLFS